MPADFGSTARALALPISPIGSPSPESAINRPAWSRHRSISNRRTLSGSGYYQAPLSYRDRAVQSAKKAQRRLFDIWRKLTLLQKIAVIVIFIFTKVTLILFFVYKDEIFNVITPLAEKWHDVPGGWTILWALTFISAFPPIIGYSSTVTIAGFVYGFPNGWFIVASATIAGSTASFLTSRTVLSKYVNRLVGGDKRFEALALTLQHDGLKILCMIKLCPLPYSITNGAISTFPTVHPLSYALATAITSPKLLIHVFIGSRLASLAENGGEMDAGTKAINYLSIILGVVLGGAVGYIIYQKTMTRAKELEVDELEAARGDGLSVSRNGYQDSEFGGDTDVADLMHGDDISLWDNDRGPSHYRDEFTDDEDNPFARGDLEEAVAARPGKQKP